jgi:hypothetical protein
MSNVMKFSGPKKPKTLPGEDILEKIENVLTHTSPADLPHIENQFTASGTLWMTNYRTIWIISFKETVKVKDCITSFP